MKLMLLYVKFKIYENVLRNEISSYYNSLDKTTPNRLTLTRFHINQFAIAYFEDKVLKYRERQYLEDLGRIIYKEFAKSLRAS